MGFDLAATLERNRRIVHKTLGLDAEYLDRTLAVPVPLRVRLHSANNLIGDLESTGYPMMLDTVDRVLFDIDELLANGVKIQRDGTVKLLSPLFRGLTVAMDSKEPSEGPVNEVWRVAKV